jgi:hypothetical protein
VVQAGQVQLCTSSKETFLVASGTSFVPASWHTVQHPSDGTKVLGGLGPVIHLGDVAPSPHFVEEFLAGKEPVDQEVQGAVQPVQEIDFFLGVMPVIPHELADDQVVLLLYMRIVILVVGTGTDNAPRLGQKGSGVRVISRVWQKRTRWPFMNSVPLSAWREITCPGYRRRVHAGLDGDPATQRSAPGMRDGMQEISLAFSSKEPPDRCRAHLEESSDLLIEREMSMGDEVLHKEEHASCQTDRTQEGASTPDGDECLLDQRAIPGRTVPVDMLRGISHEDTVSQEVPLSCQVQDTGRMSPAVSSRFTEVVQHHRFLGLPCLQVCLCLDHRQLLPFLHRELHSHCSFLISRTSTLLSSFTSVFS